MPRSLPSRVIGSTVATGGGGGGFTPTKFLATTGSDSNSGLDASHPWQTFAHAWGAMSAGDVLQVANGSYTSADPPAGQSGSAGNEIVIQAATDGGVVITDGLEFFGNSYLRFIGIRVTAALSAIQIQSNGVGAVAHHLTFQRISWRSAKVVSAGDGDVGFNMGDGTHHCLVEDSFGWFGGRYILSMYGGPGNSNLGADFNTFRRVVLRQGNVSTTGGNPAAALAIYYATSNIFDNVLILDGKPNASGATSAGIYLTGHAPPPNADFNKIYGAIVLNQSGDADFDIDTAGASASGTELRNSVLWGGQKWGAIIGGGTINSAIIDHCTIGVHGQDAVNLFTASGIQITNTLFKDSTGFGVSKGGSATVTVNNNNGYFNNAAGARNGLSAGTNDITTDPQLLYITRIEASSPYHNAGSVGDIGANVIKRYVDGSLTADDLWPWPYEARIRSEMGADFTDGFCGPGETLTHYVWNQLGNGSPY